MNKQLQANRRIGEAGQVLPLIALGLAVVMGFAGMAVDVGYLQYRQQQQQSATDAAALGGAQRLASAGCPGQSVAKAAAQLDAADNGYTDGSGGVTVAVQNPPAQGSYSDNSLRSFRDDHHPKRSNFFHAALRLFERHGRIDAIHRDRRRQQQRLYLPVAAVNPVGPEQRYTSMRRAAGSSSTIRRI